MIDTTKERVPHEQEQDNFNNFPSIMAHFIPYFPNRDLSMEVALSLLRLGAKYIEVQFPFSDPSADGPLIEKACHSALREGFRVNLGFEFIEELQAVHNSQATFSSQATFFLMTYASIAYSYGIRNFVSRARKANISALIIPDLPFDQDEGILQEATDHGIEIIPVLAINTSPMRIQQILHRSPQYVYCVLRRGITGNKTELGNENLAFLQHIKNTATSKILAGFGIREWQQVRMLKDFAHAAVAGSCFIQAIENIAPSSMSTDSVRMAIEEAMNTLYNPAQRST